MTQNDMNMTFYVKTCSRSIYRSTQNLEFLYSSSTLLRAHGVLRRNVSELLKFGFFLKQLILMR